MKKYFWDWHQIKQGINNESKRPYYHEREIWWCSMGLNVGFEQDGKGRNFSRPTLILKKFNKEVFWGIPLTTKMKDGKYYFRIKLSDNLNRALIISQIRLFDSKRLQEKMDTIDTDQFHRIKKTLI